VGAIHTPFGACADNRRPCIVTFGNKARRRRGVASLSRHSCGEAPNGGGLYAKSISRLATLGDYPVHFTPTSASWINLVERFFGLITEDAIRRGVFHSVADLEAAITDYLAHHNADPYPFIWTAPAADILKKVARGRQVLVSAH
jgi:hypothetical protein